MQAQVGLVCFGCCLDGKLCRFFGVHMLVIVAWGADNAVGDIICLIPLFDALPIAI